VNECHFEPAPPLPPSPRRHRLRPLRAADWQLAQQTFDTLCALAHTQTLFYLPASQRLFPALVAHGANEDAMSPVLLSACSVFLLCHTW